MTVCACEAGASVKGFSIYYYCTGSPVLSQSLITSSFLVEIENELPRPYFTVRQCTPLDEVRQICLDKLFAF